MISLEKTMPRVHVRRWPVVLLVASFAGCHDQPSAPTSRGDPAPRDSSVAVVETVEVASPDQTTSIADHTADVLMIRRAIESLSDPSEHARRNAAESLGKFGPAAKEAVDELIRALSQKSDDELRMYAARALGAIGPDARQAVPALRQALSDRADFGSRMVRAEAAKALGRVGPESAALAVDELLPLLGDDDLYVRRAASQTLGQLGQKAVLGLIRSLEHENPEVRFQATTALARMRDTARPALVQALTSENVFVRQGAARAFASYYVAPQVKAVPALIEHLRDEDPAVRKSIATALAECVADSREALSALLRELRTDDELAFEIVVALSRTANREKALQGLFGVLDDQPPHVRGQVIRAVGLADHDRQTAALAVPVLQEALSDPEVGMRAAEALLRIAPENNQVKRQLDAYFAHHKVDGPYPGYRDDVRLAVRNMDYEGPEFNFSAPEAISAARRIFSNLDFVGKSEREVVAILGDPQALSGYARAREDAPASQLVYCYASGYGGLEYRVIFKDGRVDSVQGGALY